MVNTSYPVALEGRSYRLGGAPGSNPRPRRHPRPAEGPGEYDGGYTACDALRAALPTDEATWVRARDWVASQAVAALAYYTQENNPLRYHQAESWLELVLS